MRCAAAALLLGLALPAGARDLPDLGDLPEPPRYLAGGVSAGPGWSLPVGGHWGDGGSGFKASPALVFSAARRVDELLSYGVESFYAPGYVNRSVRDLKLRLFSLTPFLRASYPEGKKVFYGVLGAGVYQWSSPAYTASGVRHPSDSGSSGGINFGGGFSFPFWFGSEGGLDLRWHKIFNVSGSALDLGSADSVNLFFTVRYGVWLRKKGPLPSP
jgi:hypothetical protein